MNQMLALPVDGKITHYLECPNVFLNMYLKKLFGGAGLFHQPYDSSS